MVKVGHQESLMSVMSTEINKEKPLRNVKMLLITQKLVEFSSFAVNRSC